MAAKDFGDVSRMHGRSGRAGNRMAKIDALSKQILNRSRPRCIPNGIVASKFQVFDCGGCGRLIAAASSCLEQMSADRRDEK